MANTRIKDISTAATTLNSDDFIAVDGSTAGTRKMAKADLISEVSSGVSGTYLEESNNLSDVASLDTSKLNMEIPDVGSAGNEVSLNSMLGTMAFQDADGVSAGTVSADQISIGTSSPSSVADGGADELVIGDATGSAVGMTVASSTSGKGRINFSKGSGTDAYRGQLSYNHSNDSLSIVTGGSTRALIDSAGRLGVNQTSPGSYWPAGDDLVVGNASDARGITISSGATSNGAIYFADGTTGDERYRGWVTYNQGTNLMSFGTAGQARWSIDVTGNFVSSGGGIDFGSTSTGFGTPSGGLLDDYEEGTFTIGTASDATGGISHQYGQYVKVGKVVTVRLAFRVSINFTGNKIDGLPFNAQCPNTGSLSVIGGGFVAMTSDVNASPIFAHNAHGTDELSFTSGTHSGALHVLNTTNSIYRITATYEVA